jgi:hypothetical protein
VDLSGLGTVLAGVGTVLLGASAIITLKRGKEVKRKAEYVEAQIRPRNGKTLAQTVEQTHDLAVRTNELSQDLTADVREVREEQARLALIVAQHLKESDNARRVLHLPPEAELELPADLRDYGRRKNDNSKSGDR